MDWRSSEISARCPLCGDAGAKPVVVAVARPGGARRRDSFVRCAGCAILFVPDFEPVDPQRLGWFLDFYLEQGAGIDVMVAPLLRLDAAAVRRYLDIGCGYGFALDFARTVLGWDGRGVDPSEIARRGARDLGVPIVDAAFGPDLDLGPGEHEVVFASEVLEHVTRPRELLAAARERLAPDGLLVLTTPDARAVDRSISPATALRVLSPGHHAILFTPRALERELLEAGFTSVRVEPVDATLRAFAARSPAGLARLGAPRADGPALVRRYLAERAAGALPGSALGCGLAYRRFKIDVQAGEWPAAAAARGELATALRQRYGVDLERPAAVPRRRFRIRRMAPGKTAWNLPNALCLAGLHELAGKGDAARALSYFTAARDGGADLLADEQRFGFADGETEQLLWESRRHVPIAAAAVAPERALVELARLEESARDVAGADQRAASLRRTRAQTFLQLVHHGSATIAAPLAPRVESDLDADADLARELEPELRFALGIASLTAGELAAAVRYFAAAGGKGEAGAESPTRLAVRWQARFHEAESRHRRGETEAAADLWRRIAASSGAPAELRQRAAEQLAPAGDSALDAPPLVAERFRPEIEPVAGVVVPLDVIAAASPPAVRIVVASEEPGDESRSVTLPSLGWRVADRLDLGFEPLACPPGQSFVIGVFASPVEDRRSVAELLARTRRAAAGRPPIALACRSTPPDTSAIPPQGGMLARRRGGETGGGRVAHGIETYWRDAHGICVGGWVHAFGEPIRRIRLASGRGAVATETFRDRPDLHGLFPGAETAGLAGFSLHLPAGAGETDVRLEVATDGGEATLPLALPDHSIPRRPAHVAADLEANLRRFAALLNERGPRATVLEIGVRDAHRDQPDPAVVRRRELYRDVRVIGLDIHPGPGVDLVGDVHRLTSFLRPGSVDGVLSASVLEHLHAPWVAAAEINRVLRPGGFVYHLAPTAWPEHSLPNDFWRFTTEGLAILFGPDTGFAVLARSALWPATVVPDPGWRDDFLEMPTVTASAMSDVLAQKVRDLAPGAVAWPTDPGADAQRARAYPLGALARRS